jgi:dienelactone hydrolase
LVAELELGRAQMSLTPNPSVRYVAYHACETVGLMGRRTTALGIVLMSSAFAAWALPTDAGAKRVSKSHHRGHHPALPDLKIAKGSLATANGVITGSFFVKNAGKGRSKRSLAVVLVAAPRKPAVVQIYAVRSLKPGATEEEAVSESVPSGVPAGRFAIRACGDYKHTVKQTSNKNDCKQVGTVTVSSGPTGPTGPGSTVPPDPANLAPDTPAFFADGLGQYGGVQNNADLTSGYWADVPTSYDATNQTPTTLLVWLHGCYGQAKYDISDVSENASESRDYVAIALQGPDGGADPYPACWNPGADEAKVLTDITQAETRFNINRRRVIIAGYSSGGDLAYRTIFENADTFAGILAINTSPYRDTGKSLADLMASAAWKFNIVQIAHASDDTYPPGGSAGDPGVTATINQLKQAGYPVDYLIRPGHHYDNDTCPPDPPGPSCIGTTYDIQHYLLPHVDADGWLAPQP